MPLTSDLAHREWKELTRGKSGRDFRPWATIFRYKNQPCTSERIRTNDGTSQIVLLCAAGDDTNRSSYKNIKRNENAQMTAISRVCSASHSFYWITLARCDAFFLLVLFISLLSSVAHAMPECVSFISKNALSNCVHEH